MVSFDKENPRPRASLPVNGASKLDLTPTKKARRSMAPRKSILKGINLNDDVTQDLTDASDMLSGRKSLARRVSFAAHAQVRLYTKDSKNPEGQSPARPPAQQPSSEPQPAPRRSSIRRRSSTAKTQNQLEAANAAIDNWEEGDSAMSLEDDDYGANAQLYVTGQNGTAEDGDEATEEEQSMDQGEDEDEGEDMDVTVSFKNNIYVSGAAKRRSSIRRRPSVSNPQPAAPEPEEEVAPPSPARSTRTDASEPMEFTVALEQAILPSKRASLANEAWANLQALQPQSSTLASPSNEMNVDDAMRRMLAASPGTARQLALDAANGVEEGDSMDMSMDGSLAGRRSVGSARDDQTMDLTSIVQSRSILGQSQLLNTTLDQEQEVAELSIHEEREQELAGLGAQGDNPFLLPPPPSLPPPTSEQQDLAHSTAAAAAAAATSGPGHSMFSSIGAGFNFNNHDDPLLMMPVSQEGGLADPPLSLPSLRFSTASAHGDQLHAAEEEAANNVQTADWLADFITPGAMEGEQAPAAATTGGPASSIFGSSIFGKSATSTQPQPELSNSSTTRAALTSSTRDDALSNSTAGNTLANSTTSSRPLRLSTSITRNIFSRSKIPSPVKKIPSGQEESSVPMNSFMSPPVRGTPRRNESPTRTPSRATTGAKVAPPTFTFSPAKSTSSTPNRNGKRPAEEALEATGSPAKKKVALGDALDRPTPQRAVSAEPAFTPSLLAKTSTTSLAPPPETPRETSAPPDLEVQSTSSLPSGGRRSSFAARRGARKNSMIPPSGALGLSTIRELSESTMTTLGRSVAAPREEKETDDDIEVNERLEDVQEQHEEYQQPIAPASDVARSSPVRKVERNVPKIAVTEFLDMAGIRFHDNMPVQRRHTMGPEALTMTFPDGTMGPLPDDDHEFSLADYYRAEAIDLGQLEMFIWASFPPSQYPICSSSNGFLQATTEVKKQMADLNDELALLEEEIEDNPPNALLDFLEADDEVRPQIEMAFKLAKAYAKRTQRGEWYRWRMQWTKDLVPHVDEEIRNLESHLSFVREQREKLHDPMEELQQMHASLKAELEREKAIVAEIDSSDMEQLEGLRAGIAEQNIVIDGYKTDIAQAAAEADRYDAQLKERQSELQAAHDIIAASKRRGEQLGTTADDVSRKRASWHMLQDIHGWKGVRVTPELMEFTYMSSQLHVRMPMINFKPTCSDVTVAQLAVATLTEAQDQFPAVVDAMIVAGLEDVRSGAYTNHRLIVRHLDALWTSYNLVLTELRRLWIKHPLVLRSIGDGSIEANVRMILRPKLRPEFKAKVLVKLTFTKETMSRWPDKLRELGIDVQVAYGAVEPDHVLGILRNHIQSSSPSQHYCTLYDAFGEVAARYSGEVAH